MERTLVFHCVTLLLFSVALSTPPYAQIPDSFDISAYEEKNLQKPSAPYIKPSFLYPVYLRITKDFNATYDTRDNLRITVGMARRYKRSNSFTKRNASTILDDASATPKSTVKPAQKVRTLKIARPLSLVSQPLILIRNLTEEDDELKVPVTKISKLKKTGELKIPLTMIPNSTEESELEISIKMIPKLSENNSIKRPPSKVPELMDDGEMKIPLAMIPNLIEDGDLKIPLTMISKLTKKSHLKLLLEMISKLNQDELQIPLTMIPNLTEDGELKIPLEMISKSTDDDEFKIPLTMIPNLTKKGELIIPFGMISKLTKKIGSEIPSTISTTISTETVEEELEAPFTMVSNLTESESEEMKIPLTMIANLIEDAELKIPLTMISKLTKKSQLKLLLEMISKLNQQDEIQIFPKPITNLTELIMPIKAEQDELKLQLTTNANLSPDAGSKTPALNLNEELEMKTVNKHKVKLVGSTQNSKSPAPLKPSVPMNKPVIKTNPSKPAKKPAPDPPPPPPTGDVTEEEEDEEEEEEEEEDDAIQTDSENENSSEEEDDKEPNPPPLKSTNSKKPQKQLVSNPKNSGTVAAIPTKGDTGSTDLQNDKSVKKAKKKSKKKKGKKKAQLHFMPAPLGPKAEIIIRLDKGYHNVREIFSVVKGVFTNFAYRPHVNMEIALKGQKHPHEEEHEDRSSLDDFYMPENPPPWNPHSWRPTYPNPVSISKRLGSADCTDDENCESESLHLPLSKKIQYSIKKIRLPYPIYMESTDDNPNDYSPFDHLPPLALGYFNSNSNFGEKTWVRMWDKKKNGLPKVADSSEASKRVNKYQHRQPSSESLDYDEYL